MTQSGCRHTMLQAYNQPRKKMGNGEGISHRWPFSRDRRCSSGTLAHQLASLWAKAQLPTHKASRESLSVQGDSRAAWGTQEKKKVDFEASLRFLERDKPASQLPPL